jgi:TolB-like protein
MLWPNRGAPQAQASLRRELSNLLALLEAHGMGDVLVPGRHDIALRIDRIEVDAYQLAAGLRAERATFPGAFLEGMDLPDCEPFEDWLREQRAFYQRLIAYQLPEVHGQHATQVVHGGPSSGIDDIIARNALPLPPKPSLVILPLAGIGSARVAQIARGVTNEIELALIRYRCMFVVASASGEVLHRRGLTIPEIAQRLGVAFVLHGSLEQQANSTKVIILVSHGADGMHLWGNSMIFENDNPLEVVDLIARAVAAQVNSRIEIAERERLLNSHIAEPSNYQLYWKANALFRQWDAVSTAEALALCEQLRVAEPGNSWGASMTAFCHASAFFNGWSVNREESQRFAALAYQRALASGSDDPMVLGYCAAALTMIGGDLAVADRLVSYALSLLPVHQPTLFWGAWIDLARGETGSARERFEFALRINPEASTRAYSIAGIGIARLLEGEVEEAHRMLIEALQYIPTFPIALAAYAITSTRVGDARGARRAALALRAADAGQIALTLQRPEHRALFTEGLAHALSEGAVGGITTRPNPI